MLDNTLDENSIEIKNFIDDVEVPNAKVEKVVDPLENLEINTINYIPEDEEEEEVESLEDIEDETEEEVETNVETSDEEDEDDGEAYSYKAVLRHLNDEGLVDFEDSEDLEDKPELIFESVKNTIVKGIEDYKESIPDKGKKFLEYLEKGGDPDTYFEALQKPFKISDLDLSEEGDQETVVREFLKSQDYSQDEINETIADYKDSLILEKQALVASKKLDKVFAKKEDELIKHQEAIKEQEKTQYITYINTLNDTIENSTELAGLPLTKKEKDQFRQYLLATDKQGLTQYQKEVQENPVKTQLELAYLKFMKYDFSKAIKKGETEATKKLKDIFKKNEKTVTSGRSVETDTTAGDDFAAFRASFGMRKG